MLKKYPVQLQPQQRMTLQQMLRRGKHSARQLAHVRVLLKADEGLTDTQIVAAVGVSQSSVERLRRRFSLAGLEAALHDKPQPPRPHQRKINGQTEAYLIALSCSGVPQGYDHWTMQLLADRLVELKQVQSPVSDETVRRCLKKTSLSRG